MHWVHASIWMSFSQQDSIWRSIRNLFFFFSSYWIYSIAETLNILINECLKCSHWRRTGRNRLEWGSAVDCCWVPVFRPLFTIQGLVKQLHWWSHSIKKPFVLPNSRERRDHCRGKHKGSGNGHSKNALCIHMDASWISVHVSFEANAIPSQHPNQIMGWEGVAKNI